MRLGARFAEDELLVQQNGEATFSLWTTWPVEPFAFHFSIHGSAAAIFKRLTLVITAAVIAFSIAREIALAVLYHFKQGLFDCQIALTCSSAQSLIYSGGWKTSRLVCHWFLCRKSLNNGREVPIDLLVPFAGVEIWIWRLFPNQQTKEKRASLAKKTNSPHS